MEALLDSCLEGLMKEDDVTGCLLADKHGLCLAVVGKAKPECTGVVAAIAQQVSKLEPASTETPVILLESDNRKCLIQQSPTLTAAIFKQKV